MSSPELTPSESLVTLPPEQYTPFVEPAVPPAVTREEIVQLEAEAKKLGQKKFHMPEYKHLDALRKVENTYILDTHPYAELHLGHTTIEETSLGDYRGTIRRSLEAAAANDDKHVLMDMSVEQLFTTMRAVEWYGGDIVRHFDSIGEDKLNIGIGQLRAVLAKKQNDDPGVRDFVNMSLPEVQALENATLEKPRDALGSGWDTTIAPPDPVRIWQEIRQEQSIEVQSEYVDGMTLMLGMWSLSSMTVRGPEDADRQAAEEALLGLQERVVREDGIIVQSELIQTEFVDILPPTLGKLALTETTQQ